MTLFSSEPNSQQADSSSSVAPQAGQIEKRQLSISDKIGIASLVIAVLAIPVGLAIPELRCLLRLQSESCPGSITNKAESFYGEGSNLLKLNRYNDALDSFDQAIELSPNQAKFWNRRGNALEKLGKNQQALACYDKALVLDSSYEVARQNRSVLLQKFSKNPS
jgi:tetratricopeptide (TPR) repeat protein